MNGRLTRRVGTTMTAKNIQSVAMIRLVRELKERMEELSQLTGMEIDDMDNVICTFIANQPKSVQDEVLHG